MMEWQRRWRTPCGTREKLKLEIALKALKEIKNEQGKVCAEYEICEHRACKSSYVSWALADKAIHKISKIDP